MTQKLYNLDRWVKLSAGQKLEFNLRRPRSVTVDVNAPTECQIMLIDDDGEVHFLALVKGRDRLEFEVKGSFALYVDEDDVFVYSFDSDAVHSVVEAPESFTRPMQRRHRNPELEAMMRQMQHNFTRQIEKQAAHYADIFSRSSAAAAALAPAPAVRGTDGAQPASDGDGKPPADETP